MATRPTKDAADRPYPWEPMLETSVFDPWWERTLKGGARTLIPSTPRETANELFLSALPLGPVLSKLASKVGPPTRRAVQRFVDPPFEKSRRKALLDMGGQETWENAQRRNILLPDGTAETGHRGWSDFGKSLTTPGYTSPGLINKALRGSEFKKAVALWERAAETRPKMPGVLGDLMEHGNILARKIREEALEETGGAITEEASDPAIKAVVDSLLRRLGVPRGKR